MPCGRVRVLASCAAFSFVVLLPTAGVATFLALCGRVRWVLLRAVVGREGGGGDSSRSFLGGAPGCLFLLCEFLRRRRFLGHWGRLLSSLGGGDRRRARGRVRRRRGLGESSSGGGGTGRRHDRRSTRGGGRGLQRARPSHNRSTGNTSCTRVESAKLSKRNKEKTRTTSLNYSPSACGHPPAAFSDADRVPA